MLEHWSGFQQAVKSGAAAIKLIGWVIACDSWRALKTLTTLQVYLEGNSGKKKITKML